MNLDHLEQLTSEANSGVVLKNMKIHMALSPSALGNLNKKISEELDGRLYEYHRDFDGMLLHYQDAALQSNGGSIQTDEDGFPHFDVKLKAYIFKPAKDIEVTAEVYEANSLVIDCRIFGNISCTLFKKENAGHFNAGDKLKVILTEVSHLKFRTKIYASILSVLESGDSCAQNKKITFDNDDPEVVETPSTPNQRLVFNVDSEDSENSKLESNKKKKKKKRKHADIDDTNNSTLTELNPSTINDGSSVTSPTPKKKKKRSLEPSNEETPDDGSKVKKKKKKKERNG